jgi:transposase
VTKPAGRKGRGGKATGKPPEKPAPGSALAAATPQASPAAGSGVESDAARTNRQLLVEARRQKVRQLLARRWSHREIAEALTVSVRTIEDDAAAIRREAEAEMRAVTSTPLTVAAGVQQRAALRERHLWQMFERAAGVPLKDASGAVVPGKWTQEPDTKMQLALIREMRNSEKDVLAALQSLGIIYRAPERLALDMRIQSQLQQLPAGDLLAMATVESEEDFIRLVVEKIGHEAAVALFGDEALERAGVSFGAPGVPALLPGGDVTAYSTTPSTTTGTTT